MAYRTEKQCMLEFLCHVKIFFCAFMGRNEELIFLVLPLKNSNSGLWLWPVARLKWVITDILWECVIRMILVKCLLGCVNNFTGFSDYDFESAKSLPCSNPPAPPILVQTCFNYFYVPICSYNSFIVSFWKHLLHIQKWLACVFSYLQLLNENVNERSLWLSHELSTLFFYSNFLLNPQHLGSGAVSGKEGTLIIMLSMGVSYQQFFNYS